MVNIPGAGPITGNQPPGPAPAIDTGAQPAWRRTGNKQFPYAADQSDHWWILRANHGFPEHDMYTLFVDGQAVADITADPDHPLPLLASVGALHMTTPDPAIPMLDGATAEKVMVTVAGYANYGSERGDPCPFCSSDN